MAYEPTVWESGDVITSQKLNKLERGVANNVLYATITETEQYSTIDKTWREICEAPLCVASVTGEYNGEPYKTVYICFSAYYQDGNYNIHLMSANMLSNPQMMSYHMATDSPDGYPHYGNI